MDVGPVGGGGIPPAEKPDSDENLFDIVLPKDVQFMIFKMLGPFDRDTVEGVFRRLREYNTVHVTPKVLRTKLGEGTSEDARLYLSIESLAKKADLLKNQIQALENRTFRERLSSWIFPSGPTIEDLRKQLDESTKEKQKLQAQKNTLIAATDQTSRLLDKSLDETKRDRAFVEIAAMVGGLAAFNKLPVMDVSKKPRGPLDVVPEDCTARIMRGTTNDGRKFIAIRFKDYDGYNGPDSNNGNFRCCVIVERDFNGTWRCRGEDPLDGVYSDIIESGSKGDGLEKFTRFIELGFNTRFTIA